MPIDVAQKEKGRNFVHPARLSVNDFGRWNGVADQVKEIDFFAAERGIVLIHSKHHGFRFPVKPDSEIRVAKPIREWLYLNYAVTRESGFDDLL
jgi:hypothetical protein